MGDFLTKENFRKSLWFIKEYGIRAFLRHVKHKFSANAPKDQIISPLKIVEPRNKGWQSQSIWDNSREQYQKGDFKIYWELLPEVAKYQNRCMVGDESTYCLTYALNYLKENTGAGKLRGLSIGCNETGPEISFYQTGLFDSIEIFDVAEGLLEKQRRIAQVKGLHRIAYTMQDCNVLQLRGNAYHFIWAVGTIHHIENLEDFFDQINYALTDDGIFVMREYVGPNRVQFSDLQLSLVNEILSILPEKYRKTYYGTVKEGVQRISLEDLIKADPSESIRSQDIIPLIKETLEPIKIAYTGGTLLHPLLNEIASNFEGDENRNAILKLLILFEKTLVDKGVLPSDYVFCMAKKKKTVSSYLSE